jgi:hypothetical protein
MIQRHTKEGDLLNMSDWFQCPTKGELHVATNFKIMSTSAAFGYRKKTPGNRSFLYVINILIFLLKVFLLALFSFRRDMVIKMQAREPSDSILPPPSFTS